MKKVVDQIEMERFEQHMADNPPGAYEPPDIDFSSGTRAAGQGRPSASLGYQPESASYATDPTLARGARGMGGGVRGKGASALIGSEEHAAASAASTWGGWNDIIFDDWGEAVEMAQNLAADLATQARDTLVGAPGPSFDDAKALIAKVQAEKIKSAGGAKAYYEGKFAERPAASWGHQPERAVGAKAVPDPSRTGALMEDTVDEQQKAWKSLVESLHEDARFDGYDWGKTAKNLEELEDQMGRMQDHLKGLGEAEAAAEKEAFLGETFAVPVKRVGDTWLTRMETTVGADELAPLEMKTFVDFARGLTDEGHETMSKLIFNDISEASEFELGLPSMAEKLEMRAKLPQIEYYEQWLAGREALVETAEEVPEQSVGLGAAETYKTVAERVDQSFYEVGTPQAVLDRLIGPRSGTFWSGTAPGKLTPVGPSYEGAGYSYEAAVEQIEEQLEEATPGLEKVTPGDIEMQEMESTAIYGEPSYTEPSFAESVVGAAEPEAHGLGPFETAGGPGSGVGRVGVEPDEFKEGGEIVGSGEAVGLQPRPGDPGVVAGDGAFEAIGDVVPYGATESWAPSLEVGFLQRAAETRAALAAEAADAALGESAGGWGSAIRAAVPAGLLEGALNIGGLLWAGFDQAARQKDAASKRKDKMQPWAPDDEHELNDIGFLFMFL